MEVTNGPSPSSQEIIVRMTLTYPLVAAYMGGAFPCDPQRFYELVGSHLASWLENEIANGDVLSGAISDALLTVNTTAMMENKVG
jgi:hypothetical protein